MKHFIFFLTIITLFSCKVQPDAVRKTAFNGLNPPGTVWLRDSVYIDQTEVRNLDYLEYLHWLNKHDPENYASAVPDTNVWIKEPEKNEPYVHYYLTHPAYRHYPVVGVNYDQAVGFCRWRSDRVNEFAAIIHKRRPRTKIYQDVVYRLPSREEWEYAATAGNTGPFGFEKIIDNNNIPKVWVNETQTLFNQSDILVPVNYSEPNKFGCYNMIGNVSEMISEKGKFKGGNVFTPLHDCAADKTEMCVEPTWRTGFRCICIVKK
jgi:formylglycine-generating enzyme required for sulfatase activity